MYIYILYYLYLFRYILPGICDEQRKRDLLISRIKLEKSICESLPLFQSSRGNLPSIGSTQSHILMIELEPQVYFDMFTAVPVSSDLNFNTLSKRKVSKGTFYFIYNHTMVI